MEQALSAYLRESAAVVAIVGVRIDWGLRPQGSALPALGLTVVSRIPVDSDEGDSRLSTSRVQADCWAATTTGAKALATALRATLSGRHFQSLGVTFDVWTEIETDFAAELDKGGVPIHRVGVDYLINHIE